MKILSIQLYILAIFISVFQSIYATIDMQFFRAQSFFTEPRLERPWLTSLAIEVTAGSTSTSRAANGEKVPLFDLYGTHRAQTIGLGIPLDPNNPREKALIDLAQLPKRDNFATFSLTGRFAVTEALFSLWQNFSHGFFMHIFLPVRKLHIYTPQFNNLSPTDTLFPNNTTPEWRTFLLFFNAILRQYGIQTTKFKKTGTGDLYGLCGFTFNYEKTEMLDFIDITFESGVVFPTASAQNVNQIFPLPFGHNHWGFPLSLTAALGAFEWLTLGLHTQVQIFSSRLQKVRIQTDSTQHGLIKLSKQSAVVNKGTQYTAGIYAKADHVIRGLSFALGYNFAHEQATTLRGTFDTRIANSNDMRKPWTMHTIHVSAEYDFTKEYHRYGPHIGIIFNRIVSGKRILNTPMTGGTIGLDIAWDW